MESEFSLILAKLRSPPSKRETFYDMRLVQSLDGMLDYM
jgi:hypothetical protein